jgi:isopentenyl-diphosphate delta-isomerase
MQEYVVLVDKNNNDIGEMEKMEAHVKGVLHRAFSAFIFNNNNELILQQRAFEKYHSPGLWTNTCCSHPRKGESAIQAGKRRLQEELGFSTELEEAFTFIYYSDKVGNNLIEHELDHVLIGRYDNTMKLNPEEVASTKTMKIEDVQDDIDKNPDNYTEWFKIVFEQFMNYIKEHQIL